MRRSASASSPCAGFFPESHVKSVLKRAVALRLDGADFLLGLPLDYICRAYNGIGPASFPQWLRRVATFILRPFAPAVMVHDCRFHQSDGSTLMFWFANGEFRDNLFVCAREACGWWNPLRYVLCLAALAISIATNVFGWNAWIAAARVAESDGRKEGSDRKERVSKSDQKVIKGRRARFRRTRLP